MPADPPCPDLDALEQALAGMTPLVRYETNLTYIGSGDYTAAMSEDPCGDWLLHGPEIVAAVNALPGLIAEVRRLRAAQCCREWAVARQHHMNCPLMVRDGVERADQWRAKFVAAVDEAERLRAALGEACGHLDRLAECVEGEGYSREECGGATVEQTATWRALAAPARTAEAT